MRSQGCRGLEPGDQRLVLGDVVRRDADRLAHRREDASAGRSTDRARPRRSRPARDSRANHRRSRRGSRRADRDHSSVRTEGLVHGTRIAPQLSQYATSFARGPADAFRLGRRDREVARLARRADEPRRAGARGSARGGAGSRCSNDSVRSRPQPPRAPPPRSPASASISASAAAITECEPRRVRPASRFRSPSRRGDLVVERLPLLHHLELAVLEIAAVALEHVDVGLHRLQLARRASRCRSTASGRLRPRARPSGLGFVVEPLLFGAHGVPLRCPSSSSCPPSVSERPRVRLELGPLRQRRRAGAAAGRGRDRVPGRRAGARALRRSRRPA